jgi:hypothetical protein
MKTKKKNLILSCLLLLTFIITAFSSVNFASAEDTDYYTAELDLRGIELYAHTTVEPSQYFSRNIRMQAHLNDGTTLGIDINLIFSGGFTYKAVLKNGYQVYKLTFLDKRIFELTETQYNNFNNYNLTNLHIGIKGSQPGRYNYVYTNFVDPYGASEYELPSNVLTTKIVGTEPEIVEPEPAVEDDYPATSEGIQAAVHKDKITMYYLKLPVKNLGFRIADKKLGNQWVEGTGYHLVNSISPNTIGVWNLFEDAALLSNNRYHTFIITYNNIVVGAAEAALLTTWNIECTVTGWGNIFGGHITYYPKENIEINIRSEYYALFQNADFSDCTITLMYAGIGYKVRNPNDNMSDKYDLTGATLHTREVPADYDPIEEENQAPDNGGVAVDPELPPVISWVDKFANTFTKGLYALIGLTVAVVVGIVVFRYFKTKQ